MWSPPIRDRALLLRGGGRRDRARNGGGATLIEAVIAEQAIRCRGCDNGAQARTCSMPPPRAGSDTRSMPKSASRSRRPGNAIDRSDQEVLDEGEDTIVRHADREGVVRGGRRGPASG